MKKTLTTIAILGAAVGAFAQGTVVFENFTSSGSVSFVGGNSPSAAPLPGSYTLALLFNPATSTTGITQDQLTQIATYTPTATSGNGAGYFTDPTTVTTPSGTGSGVFEVVAWAGGSFTTWAQVLNAIQTGNTAGLNYVTQGANLVTFVNPMGSNPANPPATAPDNLTVGWNGNLVLTPVPEPTTIALGGLGAAALLAFRRRK